MFLASVLVGNVPQVLPVIVAFIFMTWTTYESKRHHLRTYLAVEETLSLKLIMATQSLEKKSDYVRYISHEIRTPLSVVAMGLSLIESESGPSVYLRWELIIVN